MKKNDTMAVPAKADALLHPVRLRIIKALESDRMTAGQIASSLPDVAQATLYRQLTYLEKAGVIRVVERHQVHGTVERLFALLPSESVLHYQDLKSATPGQIRRFFHLFFGQVIATFDRYFSATPDVERDQVVFYEEVVYLKPEEAAEVRQAMRNLIHRYVSNSAEVGRQAYSLTVLSVPEVNVTATVRNRERTDTEDDRGSEYREDVQR